MYAPNDKQNRNKFFKETQSLIENKSLGENLIGGNWNDVQAIEDRKSKNKQIKNSPELNQLKKQVNLSDPWKQTNPSKQQCTWKRKNSATEAGRIDFFLI